ncbi:AMP-binding protein [Suttonella sp. R2A3]|uniref:AMP-binding protein n=1 Tax=Suttonella sp. R2A3 TaxID=2908648 RepID=UPI001F33C4C4|nr:AMP-binding protein [Suttonella sp. R2A3]UJF23664.1 AMP-binding protein [Suttonella sp. R2A3]
MSASTNHQLMIFLPQVPDLEGRLFCAPYTYAQLIATAQLSASQLQGHTLAFIDSDDALITAWAVLACTFSGINMVWAANGSDNAAQHASRGADIRLADLTLNNQTTLPTLSPDWSASKHVDLPTHCHDITLTLHTSGSSGHPKAITRQLSSIFAEVDAISTELTPTTAVQIGSVSVRHLYGLTFRVCYPLRHGMTIDQQLCRFPEDVIRALARYERVQCISSPTMLSALSRSQVLDTLDERIETITSAGGLLSDAVREKINARLSSPILDVYGSTETGVIAWRRHTDWRAFPKVEIHLNPQQRLVVRSPWCAETFTTADLAYETAHGWHLHGRADAVIKLADKRVSLVALNNDISADSFVDDVHCFVPQGHQHIAAWVALNTDGVQALCEHGRNALITKLRQRVSQTHDRVVIPRYWRFDLTLPRDAQGKLSQKIVEHRFNQPIRAPEWYEHQHQQQQQPYEITLHATIPLDLFYFNGHFDRFPIVPGVVQLHWALEHAQHYFTLPSSLLSVENLKYQEMLRPAAEICLSIAHDHARDKVSFVYHDRTSQQKYASGRLVFGIRT